MPKRDSYQVSLKLILKNDNDEVLILKARPEGSLAGYYDLPGGRMDVEEFTTSFAQIIKREIAEEIGDVKISLCLKPVALGRHLIAANITSEKKDLHILYIFFEAKLLSGEVKISEEHTGFDWVDLNEHEPKKLFTSGILEGITMYLSETQKI